MANTPQPSLDDFIRRAAHNRPVPEEKPVLSPAARLRVRRSAGLLIGAGAGLIFGLASQVINPLLVRGLPLYQPPFGLFGNLALFLLLGTLFGLAATWRENVQRSCVGVVTLLMLAIVVWRLVQRGGNWSVATLVAFLSSSFFSIGALLMLLLLLFPYLLLMRWAVDSQADYNYQPWHTRRRLAGPLVALLVAGLVGAMAVYTSDEIRAIQVLNALLQQSQRAVSVEQLPPELQTLRSAPFLRYARGPYHFISDRLLQDMDILPGPFHGVLDTLAGVEYENGYSLVCRFPKSGKIECRTNYQP